MSSLSSNFLADSRIAPLRHALTGNSAARLAWLCNFEVETEWAHGHAGLPGSGAGAGAGAWMAQRLQEQGFLLAEPGDVVITSEPVDTDFLNYLDDAGLPVARHLLVPDPQRLGGAASVLASAQAQVELRRHAAEGLHLAPMGVSAGIEAVAALTGLPVAGPAAATCARVNSKIYSRRLTQRLGLREIPGVTCESLDELEQALLRRPPGPYPLIVKDAYGVSGKGLFVVRDVKTAQGLFDIVTRRAIKTRSDALYMLVEQFLDKQYDLTYQVTVARDGEVSFDFIKRTVIRNGVPHGHVIPAGIPDEHDQALRRAGLSLGEALASDGYFGVAGIDALVDDDGVLRPVVEINARLNLSTYQERVLQRFLPLGGQAVARQFTVPALAAPLRFTQLLAALGPLARLPIGGVGVFITGFGTAAAPAGRNGRLYALFFGLTINHIETLIGQVESVLASLDRTQALVT